MQRNPGGVTSLQIQWQPKADMVTKDINVASGLQGGTSTCSNSAGSQPHHFLCLHEECYEPRGEISLRGALTTESCLDHVNRGLTTISSRAKRREVPIAGQDNCPKPREGPPATHAED